MKFLPYLMLGAALYSSVKAASDLQDKQQDNPKVSKQAPGLLIKPSGGVPTKEKSGAYKVQLWRTKTSAPKKGFLDLNGKYIVPGQYYPSSSSEFEQAVRSIQTGDGCAPAGDVKLTFTVADTSVHYNSQIGKDFLRKLSLLNKIYREIHPLGMRNLKELFIDNYCLKKSRQIDLRQFLNLSKLGIAHPMGVVKVPSNLKELKVFLIDPASFICLTGRSQTQKIDIFSDGRTLNSIRLDSKLFPVLRKISYFIKGVSKTRDTRLVPYCGLDRFLKFGGIFSHLQSFTFSKSCLRKDSCPILYLDFDALERVMPNLSELIVEGWLYVEEHPSEVMIIKKKKALEGFSLKKLDLKNVDYSKGFMSFLNLSKLEEVSIPFDLEKFKYLGIVEGHSEIDTSLEYIKPFIQQARFLKFFQSYNEFSFDSFNILCEIFNSRKEPLEMNLPIKYGKTLNDELLIKGNDASCQMPCGTLTIKLGEKYYTKQKATIKSFTPTPTPTLKTLIESGKWLSQGENPKDLYFSDLESYFPEEQYKSFLVSLSSELAREGVVPLEIDVGPHNLKIEYRHEEKREWGIIKRVEKCPTLEKLIKEVSSEDLKIESLRGRNFSLSESFWQNIKIFNPDHLSRVEVNNLSVSCFLPDSQYGLFGHIKSVSKSFDSRMKN